MSDKDGVAQKFTGGCLCGQVTYEIVGEPLAFYHCHCTRCRKLTGAAHGSNLRVKMESIHWLTGEHLIKTYKVPEAERFRNDFCSACGSPLPRYMPTVGFLILPAGSLDQEPEIKPDGRIFCGSRAEWSCRDGLAEYKKYPD